MRAAIALFLVACGGLEAYEPIAPPVRLAAESVVDGGTAPVNVVFVIELR